MNRIFKVLSDDNRYRIFVYLIKMGEACVCELESFLGIKQANLSKHLMVMRKENFVVSRQEGKYVYYVLDEMFKNEHIDLVKYIDSKEDDIDVERMECES